MSNKEDDVIQILSQIATSKGIQVLSFDLPEHGDRKKDSKYLCKPDNCIADLNKILSYANKNYKKLSLWACSMGVYFSLLAYNNVKFDKCMFLSPVVNMKTIIDAIMNWNNITENELRDRIVIQPANGPTLYYDYYNFVKNNPISKWNSDTFILYGEKDNLQSFDLIKFFSEKFDCKLFVIDDGEHYFHTSEQLDYYKNWILNIL